MFDIKSLILIVLLFIIFAVSQRKILKSLESSESKWWGLFSKLKLWMLVLELYLISFLLYITIRLFGFFGTGSTNIIQIKENLRLLEISLFFIIPLALLFSMLILTVILNLFSANKRKKKYRRLIWFFLCNKFYGILVIANVLQGITHGI